MKNIVLIGGGNQAHYTIDIINKEGKYNIIGIIDSIHDIGSNRFGYKVLGRQEDIIKLKEQYNIEGGIISIGDNWARYYVSSQIKKEIPDFKFVNAIHPSVVIGDNVELGEGIVLGLCARCVFVSASECGYEYGNMSMVVGLCVRYVFVSATPRQVDHLGQGAQTSSYRTQR